MIAELSFHLLDLIGNSLAAQSMRIDIRLEERPHFFYISVSDNGIGTKVDPAQLTDPFHSRRTERKTGLGLALLNQSVKMCGGQLRITRMEPGLCVEAVWPLDPIDAPARGIISEDLAQAIALNPGIRFNLSLSFPGHTAAIEWEKIEEWRNQIPVQADLIDRLRKELEPYNSPPIHRNQ